MVLRNEKILCLSGIGWRFLWMRMQEVMSRLADHGNQVLVVEPFVSPLTSIKYPEIGISPSWRIQIARVKANLSVLTPPVMLPFSSKSPMVMRLNYQVLKQIVRRWQAKLGFEEAIVWAYDPYSGFLVDELKRKLLVYDCADEYSEFTGAHKKQLSHIEAKLLGKADVVFVSSRALLESKRRLNSRVFLVPNGVDFAHFQQAQRLDLPLPKDVGDIPKPILGFVGLIKDWIDLDVIEFIARARPRWSIVMVGPIGSEMDIERFRSLGNVHFLGRREHDLIPRYVKAFDVCLNPFKQNALTAAVNPLKIYEYLAAGKPTVSTDIAEVRALGDVVRLASSPEGFLEQIEPALQEDAPSLIRARLELARRHDWGALVETMSQRIHEVLTNK